MLFLAFCIVCDEIQRAIDIWPQLFDPIATLGSTLWIISFTSLSLLSLSFHPLNYVTAARYCCGIGLLFTHSQYPLHSFLYTFTHKGANVCLSTRDTTRSLESSLSCRRNHDLPPRMKSISEMYIAMNQNDCRVSLTPRM